MASLFYVVILLLVTIKFFTYHFLSEFWSWVILMHGYVYICSCNLCIILLWGYRILTFVCKFDFLIPCFPAYCRQARDLPTKSRPSQSRHPSSFETHQIGGRPSKPTQLPIVGSQSILQYTGILLSLYGWMVCLAGMVLNQDPAISGSCLTIYIIAPFYMGRSVWLRTAHSVY